MVPVTFLDPTPQNDALTNCDAAPEGGGFWCGADYRGAFSPRGQSWLCRWTASDAFGFTGNSCVGYDHGTALTEYDSRMVEGEIGAEGSRSISANEVTLVAQELPFDATTSFITAPTRTLVLNAGGSAGDLQVGPLDIGRYVGPGQILDSGADGMVELSIDLVQVPSPNGFLEAMAGDTRVFQAWHRDSDPKGNATSNFTNGFGITRTP